MNLATGSNLPFDPPRTGGPGFLDLFRRLH
jgi:hypothetical protein